MLGPGDGSLLKVPLVLDSDGRAERGPTVVATFATGCLVR
jgi:hypothetical protein